MPYITSTATAGTDYTLYKKTGAGVVVPVKTISINGGANCASKTFVTRDSVATKVSKEDLELLMKHPEFVRHMEAGYIKVSKVVKEENNKGLQKEDKSAPMTPEKYKEQGKKAPVVKLEE